MSQQEKKKSILGCIKKKKKKKTLTSKASLKLKLSSLQFYLFKKGELN